ncbi:hypothetical protein MMC07_000232 [Pseudocyphellaria aurata]|nr:hypothetical protein [Pseudocyphellaria aurata]
MAQTRLRTTVPTHTRIAAIRRQRHPPVASVASCETRQFSRMTWLRYPRKDSQDRESMNTEATEYSKSSTDDEAAKHDEAAFDPNTTDPGEQKEKAGEAGGDSNNPLEVSPANPDVSKQRETTEGGAENSSASSGDASGRQRSSGGGSPSKGRHVS